MIHGFDEDPARFAYEDGRMGLGAMKVWRWHCNTHDLSLLTMQTGNEPPAMCSGLVELAYPDKGFCAYSGFPVFTVYPLSGLGSPVPPQNHSLPQPETSGKVGRVATPPLPATRHTT